MESPETVSKDTIADFLGLPERSTWLSISAQDFYNS